MYIELNTKSKTLGGLSDLTVLAPIKKGLAPSLESITYKTRLKRLLEALQLLRESSHEYSIFRSISDSAERVARIHSFRVAIVEPEDQLLLAVTFDGARESYVRVLWQRIGTLLDLLFCNTEGHIPAYGNSLAEWDAWIDRIQVKTKFFYGRPRHTSEDVLFLRDEEQTRRCEANVLDADLASVRRATLRAETVAWDLAQDFDRIPETARQGVQTIAVLHRLTAWFIPGTPDGDFLHRAARDLLPEFLFMSQSTALLDEALGVARTRFPEQIDWFLRPCATRTVPEPPTAPPGNAIKANIQGGILEAYRLVTHGALLLMAFKPGVDSAPFWRLVNAMRTAANAQPINGQLVCNVAFTHEGLRAAGLVESELAAFPLEFREGMAARCSVLGDVRTNHPRRWRLPRRNWSGGPRHDEAIELSAVHVVLQLRIGNPPGMPPETRIYELDDQRHPLYGDLQKISAALLSCMELLSLEPMVRHLEAPTDPNSRAKEHFGFVDGNGQPVLDPADVVGAVYKENLVHPGEFLVGQANAADPKAGEGPPAVSPWLQDGSFLVVRKLSQDVALFDEIVGKGASGTSLSPDDVAAKMMGRTKNGDSLAAPGAKNDFTYRLDPEGQKCPFHAHARRANPRSSSPDGPPELPGGRPPRLMRRSLSYGPPFDRLNLTNPVNSEPRGMFFMAYNARIGEQFEVVQRWLAGGNSTGGLSGRSDPFVGVPASGEKRVFSFEGSANSVLRVTLDGDSDPEVLARTMVRLEWGAYLFTPALDVLAALGQRAAEQVAQWPWSADRGRAEIDRLLGSPAGDADRVAAWKTVLEDPDAQKSFLSASVWAAIRRDFGGVLRTPYGVLAASHEHAMAVLADPQANYSVAGYRERTAPTLGDIYLGLDDRGPGCPYRLKSEKPNLAIQALAPNAAFDAARRLATASLGGFIQREKEYAQARGESDWQLTFSAKEVWDEVLEGLCREWFGLPAAGESAFIEPSTFRWDWDPRSAVLYPGNFVAPSRYIFQPQPGHEVMRVGSLHGTTMNAAFRSWVKQLRDQGAVPKAPSGAAAPLAKAIFDAFPRSSEGDDPADAAQDALVAETLLGALIGFLPTVEGNLRQSLNEWLLDGTFWSLRAALKMPPSASGIDLSAIEAALYRSMQLRPSPEIVWRRATRAHSLGEVHVENGETVVVAIVSATHELIERNIDDVSPIFGGVRAAGGPTHACPGRVAALGTLLGILTALLETGESLRPMPSPLSFRIEGVNAPSKPQAPQKQLASQQTKALLAIAGPAGAGRTLLVAGDSWFNYMGGRKVDLASVLHTKHGFEVSNLAQSGRELDFLAKDGLGAISTRFNELAQQGKRPEAILISAGGNDVVGKVLLNYVLPFGAGPGGLDDAATKRMMDGPPPTAGVMRLNIRKILDTLGRDCKDASGKPARIVWQGYDDPIPDARILNDVTSPGGLFTVLYQYLKRQGYATLQSRCDVMQKVVIRYNALLVELSQDASYSGFLVHADLRGTLVKTVAGEAYKQDWLNEMHPTPAGFEKLTDQLVTKYLQPVPVVALQQPA